MTILLDFIVMISWAAFSIGLMSFPYMIYDLMVKSIYYKIYKYDHVKANRVYSRLMENGEAAEPLFYGFAMAFGFLFGIYWSI